MRTKIGVAIAFVLVLALPLLVRTLGGGAEFAAGSKREGAAARKLVVVTPHVEQIRLEFADAFDAWHRARFGESVEIDWRVPGGTSEIVKQIEAQALAAARQGQLRADGLFEPGAAGSDVFFGGGSYEHGKIGQQRKVSVAGAELPYRLALPAGFTQEQLDEWFGENRIGTQLLYDTEQHWIGTALSGFGIVYNRDTLRELGLPEPRGFRDLCDFGYFNMLALADGRLSGSLTTTYESILNKEGWDGWRTLRELCANARYFASASTRPPVDVSQGEAAAGLAIDFYGRGQSQFVLKPGQSADESRVGYVDPEGAVYIDADPATILNGCNDFELARRFVEFCLTEEGQALWQFHSTSYLPDPGSEPGLYEIEKGGQRIWIALDAKYPKTIDGRFMGPRVYELRRMPVRRVMYEKYLDRMVDKENPFELASDVPGRGWRDAIAPMMAAFGIDTAEHCRAAWKALNQARRRAARGEFSEGALAEMEAAFYAMPRHRMADGSELEFSEANYKAISADVKKWRDPERARRAQIEYAAFFRARYREVLQASTSMRGR